MAPAALSRAQSLAALDHADASRRAQALQRLAEIGTMADTERVARRLRDDVPAVRELANLAMWQIWGRSGDRAIDALFERGVEQMRSGDLPAAHAHLSRRAAPARPAAPQARSHARSPSIRGAVASPTAGAAACDAKCATRPVGASGRRVAGRVVTAGYSPGWPC